MERRGRSTDPIREGERVVLVRTRPEDAQYHFAIWCDTEVQRAFNAPLPWPTLEAFEGWLANRRAPRFTATVVEWVSGDPVGFVTLAPEGVEPDLAILLDAGTRGRGLGTEAMRLAADHVLEALGLPFVVAGAYEGNTASLRMLEKAGFVRMPEDDEVEEDRFGPGRIRQLAFRYPGP